MTILKKFFLNSRRMPQGLGLLFLGLVFVLAHFDIPYASQLIHRMNFLIYDEIVNHYSIPSTSAAHVIIVDIDDKSIKKIGRWPWPRDITADLLEKLNQAGVVVSAFDMVMSEPDINYAIALKKKLKRFELNESISNLPAVLNKLAPHVDNDRILADKIKEYDVVLGFLFDEDREWRRGHLPQPLQDPTGKPIKVTNTEIYNFIGYKADLKMFIEASPHGGFVSNFADIDGIVRHGLLIAGYENTVYPSLALATAMRYLLADKTSLLWQSDASRKHLKGLKIDGTFIPTNTQGKILLPFYGPPGTLDYYSAVDIMEGKVGDTELQGSIAIIGSSIIILSDLHPTPLSRTFPGAELVGNMVKAIIEKQVPTTLDWQQGYGLLFQIIFGVLLVVLFSLLRYRLLILISMMLMAVFLTGSLGFFVYKNIYIPVAEFLILILGLTAINHSYLFIIERRKRKKVHHLFGQYVPESYVNELLQNPEKWTLEGQVRVMTVFFSDVRNFTGISEGLTADKLKAFLNKVLTAQTDIIHKHQGTIDKYVGDMVVAFWGAPITDQQHSVHAVSSALEIAEHIPEVNKELQENNLPLFQIGIGLASGSMSVGDMGSKFRRAYTVIGDTVNLGSRLEALTKYYKVDILTNDEVPSKEDPFVWRPVDKVLVKGKKQPVTIYQPLGLADEVPAAVEQELEAYKKALDAYYDQDWRAAKKSFEILTEANPEVYLYQMYLSRIEELQATPPPEDWDGVYVHIQKSYD